MYPHTQKHKPIVPACGALKEGWQVLVEEGLTGGVFSGYIGSHPSWWSVLSGASLNMRDRASFLGRGKGLTSLAVLSAAAQITFLWITRVHCLFFHLIPLSLEFHRTASPFTIVFLFGSFLLIYLFSDQILFIYILLKFFTISEILVVIHHLFCFPGLL